MKIIIPYIGGENNVSRQILKANEWYITVKDEGMVNLEQLHQIEDFYAVELARGRLKITVKGIKNLEEKKMGKYEQLAKDIVANVGGKENVNSVVHCVTRLRFHLKNESKANTDVLKNMDGVVTVIKSGGQYQIVIGNHVNEVYKDVCDVVGVEMKPVIEEDKRSVMDKILSFISEALTPSAAVLCASGMLKGILALISTLGLIATDSGFYVLLSSIADTGFYFIPVLIGYNVAKKMNMNLMVGMTIGLALCYPKINGVDLEIFGHVFNNTYTSTLLPVVFTVILAAYVEKFFNKVLPNVIKNFLTPLLVLGISVPLGYAIVGPIANGVAGFICKVILGVNSFNPVIAAIVIGAFYQVLVIFGIHGVFIMAVYMNVLNGVPDPNYAALGVCSFAQTGVVFAIWLKTKNRKLKDIALPAAISGVFGITEPAIYGVTLPRMKHFVVSCVASAVAAAVGALLGLCVYTIPGMGIFKIPGYINPADPTGSLVLATIIMILATALGFIGSFILYKDEDYGD